MHTINERASTALVPAPSHPVNAWKGIPGNRILTQYLVPVNPLAATGGVLERSYRKTDCFDGCVVMLMPSMSRESLYASWQTEGTQSQ